MKPDEAEHFSFSTEKLLKKQSRVIVHLKSKIARIIHSFKTKFLFFSNNKFMQMPSNNHNDIMNCVRHQHFPFTRPQTNEDCTC